MMAHVVEYGRHIGAGILVIEHNVELVADVCDRVIVMDSGEILADGTAESVMGDERVIAAYLGS
jgi:branched-chain amino acid transport system ATP-binding protein